MAKKEKEVSKVDDIFSQLITEQNNLFTGAAASGADMFSDVKMYISTGSAIFDTVISNKEVGGWPCGRIVEVFGEEAIGKSTLAFQAMANCQKMGGIPIYFDVEQAGSREMMKACGVDLNRLIISGLTSIEEVFGAMEQNLTTIINNKAYKDKPIFIVIDSLAQMTTDAEVEADYDNNMMLNTLKAKQIGKALRKISPFLRKANACLYIVNQTRSKIGVMFGDPTTTTSGKALPFAASLRIKLLGKSPVVIPDPFVEQEWEKMLKQYEFEVKEWQDRGKLGSKPEKPKKPKGDEVIIGYQVTARTEKNKIGPPKREAEFTIIFSQGIMEEDAWLDYGVKYNVIRQLSSTEFEFINHPEVGKFKRKEFKGILADVELHDEIKKELVSKLVRAPLATEINDEEEEEELTEN